MRALFIYDASINLEKLSKLPRHSYKNVILFPLTSNVEITKK